MLHSLLLVYRDIAVDLDLWACFALVTIFANLWDIAITQDFLDSFLTAEAQLHLPATPHLRDLWDYCELDWASLDLPSAEITPENLYHYLRDQDFWDLASNPIIVVKRYDYCLDLEK